MRKKIKIDDLQVGMFIHDFQCDWNDQTIFIDKMMVNDLKVVEILRVWGIREVIIDTARGIDLGNAPSGGSTQSVASMADTPELSTSPRTPVPSPVPIEHEMKQALKLKNTAVAVMHDITKRASEGKPPNVGLAYELASKMMSSVRRNRDALVLLTRIRKKDEYTLYHSMSVSSLMLTFCDYKGISEKRALDLAVGALLHDIGKTMIPDAILNKPAKLTPAEFTIMKKHVEFSVDLLHKTKNLPLECFDIALHHHEKMDGSGYPHGLKQDKIGMAALMAAICDVFDAVTSARCYKEGMGTVSGLKLIYDNCGSHFQKKAAYEFIECMGVYPVGSCVRLSDDRIGIVSGRTSDMHRPIIRIIRDERRKEKFSPFSVDLSRSDTSITGYEDLQALGLNPSAILALMYQEGMNN